MHIITPYEASCFVRYFTSVESVLGLRFSLGYPPDEEHLTSTLCELLDEKGAELHNLIYSLKNLNDDLAKSGILQASIKIETTKYNKWQERRLTQCDLGFVVNYQDRINGANGFIKGILIQAKRLYPNGSGSYSLTSKYEGYDLEQHKRLEALIEERKQQCSSYGLVYYLMYNPPLSQLTIPDQDKVIYRQRENQHWYHDLPFNHYRHDLHNFTTDIQNVIAPMQSVGISALFVPFERMKNMATQPKLVDIVEQTDIVDESMPQFLVYGLFDRHRGIGCSDGNVLRLIRGERPKGDSNEVVLPPRYVIEFTITAGRSVHD